MSSPPDTTLCPIWVKSLSRVMPLAAIVFRKPPQSPVIVERDQRSPEYGPVDSGTAWVGSWEAACTYTGTPPNESSTPHSNVAPIILIASLPLSRKVDDSASLRLLPLPRPASRQPAQFHPSPVPFLAKITRRQRWVPGPPRGGDPANRRLGDLATWRRGNLVRAERTFALLNSVTSQ